MKTIEESNDHQISMDDERVLPTVFSVGSRIWFSNEKRPYRVKASDERFTVCTKPHNPMKTVMYTIIDFKRQVRGTENLVFCMGFETDELCQEALGRLQKEESEVSYRNNVPIDIVRWDNGR